MNKLCDTHPELCSQWHKTLNQFTAHDVVAGSNKKAWWQCDVAPDHVWQCAIVDRIRRNTGCPFCNGKRGSSTNNVAKFFPDLTKEWHYEMNELSPESYPHSSMKKVWWKCSRNHEWQATINNRADKGQGCPYCAGKKADRESSILIKNPELCEEWDYAKNVICPSSLLPSSHKKFHWICKKDSTHKWVASLLNRTLAKSKCPYCHSSAGEVVIKNYLIEQQLQFSRQYRIPECKNKNTLPFDFAIHLKDSIVLVEFQGKQHYETTEYYGGLEGLMYRQKNDEIKRNYCKSNGIQLIEIRYDEIKDIPRLLGVLL